MSIEKMNPYEGVFKPRPEDARNNSPEEKARLKEKIEAANTRLKEKSGKAESSPETEATEQEKNFEFLSKFPGLWDVVEEWEEKLGNVFMEQREEIVTALRKFEEKKTKINLEDEKEMKLIEETLKEKLGQELENRFKQAM